MLLALLSVFKSKEVMRLVLTLLSLFNVNLFFFFFKEESFGNPKGKMFIEMFNNLFVYNTKKKKSNKRK